MVAMSNIASITTAANNKHLSSAITSEAQETLEDIWVLSDTLLYASLGLSEH